MWIWKSLKYFKGYFLTVRFLFIRKKRTATSGNDQIFVSLPLIHFSWKMKQAVWFVRFISNLSEEGITLVEMKLYCVQVRLLKHTPCKKISSEVNVSNFFACFENIYLDVTLKKGVSAWHLYEVYNSRLFLLFVKPR